MASEPPVELGDLGDLLHGEDAGRDRRPALARVEERHRVGAPAEHGHADRLEQLGGRLHVEEGLGPEATTSASVRASSPRSAEMSGRSAQPRWTPPSPPVPRKPMPTARQTASVPPAVVAPRTPWAAQAARSRGPTLRASASSPKRSSCSSVRPTWMTPSTTPIVAGTAQAARTRRSASAATARPRRAGSRARRASSRARRRAGEPRARRAPPDGCGSRSAITGIAPIVATQRAAASSAELGPPRRKPAAKASPAPVVSTTSRLAGGQLDARRRRRRRCSRAHLA